MTTHGLNNPYKGTSADTYLNDNLTTIGGNCYDFGSNTYIPVPVLSDDIINFNLIPIPCFAKPPIINNDVIDYPFPTPPPVTTGCYPLRARAQTISDDDDPSGISAEFVENPAPGKCFPILDIKLNLKPIITDVLGIIIPGGGNVFIPDDPLGCCCDEFGSWYSTNQNCYPGRMSDCIGQDMSQYVGSECCNQWDSGTCAVGGIGVRWERDDEDCSMCNPNYDCCLASLWSKWASPQILGIGKVVWGAEGTYTLDIAIPEHVAGVGEGSVSPTAVNIAEGNERQCTSGTHWIPGVEMSDLDGGTSDSEYPEGFEPQNICPGTWVTAMAVTTKGWDDMGLASDINIPEKFEHGGLYGTHGLRVFFSHPFVHDGTCQDPDA